VHAWLATTLGEQGVPRMRTGGFHFSLPLVPATALDRIPSLQAKHRPALAWGIIGGALAAIALGFAMVASADAAGATSSVTYERALMWFLASTFVHEGGHALAARWLGARVSWIRFGFFWVLPVLATDLRDCWRLPRVPRIAVTLAGPGVQSACAIGLLVAGAARLLPQAEAAAGGAAIMLGVTLALLPLFRQDGYWVLADLLDVPYLGAPPAPDAARGKRRMIVAAYAVLQGGAYTLLWSWMVWVAVSGLWTLPARLIDLGARTAGCTTGDSVGACIAVALEGCQLAALYLLAPVAGLALLRAIGRRSRRVWRWPASGPSDVGTAAARETASLTGARRPR